MYPHYTSEMDKAPKKQCCTKRRIFTWSMATVPAMVHSLNILFFGFRWRSCSMPGVGEQRIERVLVYVGGCQEGWYVSINHRIIGKKQGRVTAVGLGILEMEE